MILDILKVLFGFGGNRVKEVAEVFVPNAEKRAADGAELDMEVLRQFAAEFMPRRSWFDILIDGLNRLPRPLLTFGTLYLFIYAAIDTERFVDLMAALSVVPEPVWVLASLIVTFFFGGRYQVYQNGGPSAWRRQMLQVRREYKADGMPDPVEDWEKENG